MYDVLSSKKKKIKRSPSLKFRCLKSEIFRPPLLEIGSSWARYFRSGISTCDVIFLTREWFTLDRLYWCQHVSRVLILVCRFRDSFWVKFFTCSGSEDFQSYDSNHTMIVPSQLLPKKLHEPVRWKNSCRGIKRVWGHASKSICWRNRSTRLVFYLVSLFRLFLRLSLRVFL